MIGFEVIDWKVLVSYFLHLNCILYFDVFWFAFITFMHIHFVLRFPPSFPLMINISVQLINHCLLFFVQANDYMIDI